MTRKQPQTYAASLSRLRILVARLESDQVDVDELEAVVKESVELITACRSRLRATQSSVDTLLAGLQDGGAATLGPAPSPPVAELEDDETDPFSED